MQDQQKPNTVTTAGGLHVPPGMRRSDELRSRINDNYQQARPTLKAMEEFSKMQTALAMEFAEERIREDYPDAEVVEVIPVFGINARQSPPTTEQQLAQLRQQAKNDPSFPRINVIQKDPISGQFHLMHRVGAVERARVNPPIPPKNA